MPKAQDVTGNVYGRLTVLKEVSPLIEPSGRLKRRVECVCDCGTVKQVGLHHLRSGDTLSCGCLKVEKTKKANTTHGATVGRTKGECVQSEYVVWAGIRARCKPGGHKDYSERGILMCDSWWEDYANFYADMGTRPSPDHSIDRIDNDKGYCKDNCRWATAREQSNNRRSNIKLTFYGMQKTLEDWSRITGVPSASIRQRLKRGWPPKYAVWANPGTKLADVLPASES